MHMLDSNQASAYNFKKEELSNKFACLGTHGGQTIAATGVNGRFINYYGFSCNFPLTAAQLMLLSSMN